MNHIKSFLIIAGTIIMLQSCNKSSATIDMSVVNQKADSTVMAQIKPIEDSVNAACMLRMDPKTIKAQADSMIKVDQAASAAASKK